ncbi:hypothetical protein [uncultured Tyzzerella sp.]|uniref:hypothetical protein n=1 Tax=uncultured Tyzzerella sp. TaxID=2321398 RepID=UPI0029427382|nr:hypothetical protein [uncultured Tyzzerella sp.]
MIKAIVKKLKEKDGNMYILASFIMVFIFMVTYLFSLYFELKTISKGIRDAVQIATIKTITHNYSNVFRGTRQGYATGHKPLGEEEWEEVIDYGKIYEEVGSLLNLKEENGQYIKYTKDDKVEYKIHSLNVTIDNIEIGSLNTVDKFNANVTIKLEVPQTFLGINGNLKLTLNLKAGYVNKF